MQKGKKIMDEKGPKIDMNKEWHYKSGESVIQDKETLELLKGLYPNYKFKFSDDYVTHPIDLRPYYSVFIYVESESKFVCLKGVEYTKPTIEIEFLKQINIAISLLSQVVDKI